MKFISLFAGVGGFDLGMKRAGHECVAMVEYDQQAAGVLAHRFPDIPIFCDVRKVSAYDLPEADFITYGFPCQDLSQAGKRAGLKGKKSGLFYEAARLIRGMQRRGLQLALAENVAGLLSADDGVALAECVGELLDSGARDVGWRILDSQWCGVAQRRRRVFLVADFTGERCDEILALTESLRGHLAPRREAGQGDAEAAGTSVAASSERGIICRAGDQANADISPTVLCWPPFSRTGNAATECDAMVAAFQPRIGRNGRGYSSPGEPINALSGADAGATSDMRPCVAFSGNQQGQLVESEITRSLAGGGGKPGQGYAAIRYARSQVRRLTPTECERLQGFPDEWTAERAEVRADGNAWRVTGEVVAQGDTARYKQMGNAVTVNVAEWIGQNIKGI